MFGFGKRKSEKEALKAKEAKKAAIALNLCTVSLSQIVDYNDINVLRLEYESILNNLNLEKIIKDEALLEALKKILDTCHFYILHEKDKDILRKRQAMRLKNVLGNALSGRGGIVALFGTPNPWAIAATAAVMVGAATISYKTQRNQILLENAEEEWELQRTALEQLHNLRRTLFDTAWRLADTYQFKDEWRLTERQISLYNQILQDPDPLDRHERLDVISGQFHAYPPFWYYKARAALEAAEREKEKNPEFYWNLRVDAQKALEKFDAEYTGNELLREDIVAASAYIDYTDFLELPRDKREQSVDQAVKLAGLDFEIMQMGVFRYLEIGTDSAKEKAIRLLKSLVNERFNMSLNGRLLSRLYIEGGHKGSYDRVARRMIGECSFRHRHILAWNDDSCALPDETYSLDYWRHCFSFFNHGDFEKLLTKYFDLKLQLAFADFLNAFGESERQGNTAPLLAQKEQINIDKKLETVWEQFLSSPQYKNLFQCSQVASFEFKGDTVMAKVEAIYKDVTDTSWLGLKKSPKALAGSQDKLEKLRTEFLEQLTALAKQYAKWGTQMAITRHNMEEALEHIDALEFEMEQDKKSLVARGRLPKQ